MISISNFLASLRGELYALCLLTILLTVTACHGQTPEQTVVEKPVSKLAPGTRIPLTIYGYNYTNRYIDQFSVDGQGGGNLFVSGPGGGGGGSVCCVTYFSGFKAKKVTVRWQADACKYKVTSSITGETFSEIHSFFKEVEVQVDSHIPDDPHYFEVHFYPDGHVEAVITYEDSMPRLILSKDRDKRTPYPRCPNDKKPKE